MLKSSEAPFLYEQEGLRESDTFLILINQLHLTKPLRYPHTPV